MKVEVLIATMFNDNPKKLLYEMNIQSDCVIVNQCDIEKDIINEFVYKGCKVRVINTNERGLSRSRNKALNNLIDSNDIVVFTDDDIRFVDDYQNNIIAAYKKSTAAGIVFNVKRANGNLNKKMPKRLNQLTLFRACSVSLTFRAKEISEFKFDSLFGAGSKVFILGEENIFVSDILKSGKIIETTDYVMCEIVDRRESTWFTGFNESFLESKGASFKRMHDKSYILFVFDFAFRKYKLYRKNLSYFRAIKTMLKGCNKYKKIKERI